MAEPTRVLILYVRAAQRGCAPGRQSDDSVLLTQVYIQRCTLDLQWCFLHKVPDSPNCDDPGTFLPLSLTLYMPIELAYSSKVSIVQRRRVSDRPVTWPPLINEPPAAPVPSGLTGMQLLPSKPCI